MIGRLGRLRDDWNFEDFFMTQRFSRRIAISLLLSAALSAFGTASSASAQQTAQQFVEARHASAQALLRRPANDARNRDLSRLFEDMLDYDELARRSLSRHWTEHNAAEQTQFTSLLRQLV